MVQMGRQCGSKFSSPKDNVEMVLPPPGGGGEMWDSSSMGMKLPISKAILEQLAMLSAEAIEKAKEAEKETAEKKEEETKQGLLKYFEKMPTRYSYPVYRKAAKVYQALKREAPQDEEAAFLGAVSFNRPTGPVVSMPQLEYSGEEEQRLVFELAFKTLKYQLIIEDLLAETAFFAQYPEIRDDESTVSVVVCDFLHRKFQIRSAHPDDAECEVDLARVEKYIMGAKTKLCAALAKNRIKAKAPSIDYLLPEFVRQNDPYTKTVPIYAWVNILRVGLSGATDAIKKEGYKIFMANRDTVFEGKLFRMDPEFPDTFVFPSDQQMALKAMSLFADRKLVIQDRSSIVGPHCVRTVLGEGTDVIITNVDLALTAVHVASLAKGNDTIIHAFGAGSDLARVQASVERMGASKYVRVYREKFLDVDLEDGKWRAVRTILVIPDCSKSAIANPIDFIVNEGQDMSILKDFTAGKPDATKLAKIVQQHNTLLRFALKFPRVQHVFYSTRSTEDAENEKVVVKSLEHHTTHSKRGGVFRINRIHLGSTGKGDQRSVNVGSSFLKVDRTENDSGCFVALLTREADDGGGSQSHKKTKKDKKKKLDKKGSKDSNSKLHKESTVDNSDESDHETGTLNENGIDEEDDDQDAVRRIASEGQTTSKKKKKKGTKKKKTDKSQSMTARIPTGGEERDAAKAGKGKPAEHQKVIKHPAPFRPDEAEEQ